MKFNNCTPFKFDGKISEADLDDYKIVDPEGHQWRTHGVSNTSLWDHDTTYPTLVIQFAERILPAKVRDEHLAKLLDKFQQREGRKPSKKEFAMLRQDVETALLPRAFIRRNDVPVTFFGDHLYIWSSSSTKVDVIVSLLVEMLQIKVLPFGGKLDLRSIADGSGYGYPGKSIVFRGDDKQAIRIKDVSVDSSKVQTLLEDPTYRVTDVHCIVDQDEGTSFVLNENLVFKKIEIGEFEDRGDEATIYATCRFMSAVLGDIFVEDEDEL